MFTRKFCCLSQFVKLLLLLLCSLTYLTLLFSTPVFSQSVIYSVTRCPPTHYEPLHQNNDSNRNILDKRIIHQTVTSSSLSPTSVNTTQISQDASELKIHVRSKRNMQKMPRPAESLPLNEFSSAQRALLKESSKNISLVLAGLLDNYDHNQRPGYGGPPAVITTNLEIRSMGPISELDMEYSLDCYFRQKWQDERLQYNSTNTPFLSLNIKMLDKIWKPDTYFHTGKGSHLHMITTPNKFLRISKTGGILYSMRLTIKSLCPMDLHSFPMDKQSCPLILGSYGYPADQLVYKWDTNPVTFNSRDFTLSQYDIVKTITRNDTQTFKRGVHTMLQVNFNLRRHVGYFLIQIYVPCSLIVVLSWVSFWINREATADRVGLGATSVLTLSTFGIDSRRDLPRVSYPTALDWYTHMCFLFVVSTLLEFAGVHYFTKVGTGEVPIIELDDRDDDDDVDDDDIGNELCDDHNAYSKNGRNINTNNNRSIRAGSSVTRERIVSRKHVDKWRSRIHARKIRAKALQSSNKFREQTQLRARQKLEKQIWTIETHSPRGLGDTIVHTASASELVPPSHPTNLHASYCPKSAQYSRAPLQPNGLPARHSGRLRSQEFSYLENYVSNKNLKDGIQETNRHRQQIYPTFVNPELAFVNDCVLNNLDDNQFSGFGIQQNEQYQINDEVLEGDDDDEDFDDEYRGVIYALTDCCLQFWYCFTSNEKYRQEMKRRRTSGRDSSGAPTVNSVSRIDKASRILFPLIFTVLNLLYWFFYINERNSEFNQWE